MESLLYSLLQLKIIPEEIAHEIDCYILNYKKIIQRKPLENFVGGVLTHKFHTI